MRGHELDELIAASRTDVLSLVDALRRPEPPLTLPAPAAPFGSLSWRPALRRRHDVSWLSCRAWRIDAKAVDLPLLRAVKAACEPSMIAACAAEMVAVLGALVGSLPGWTVTSVAPGHSRRHENFGVLLGRRVARELGLPWCRFFADRFLSGSSHPRQFARLPPLVWLEMPATPVLVVDDLATSGYHIEEAVTAIRAQGVSCLAVVWLAREVAG